MPAREEPPDDGRSRTWIMVVAGVVAALGVAVVARRCSSPPETPVAGSAAPSATAPGRCAPISQAAPFVVGDKPGAGAPSANAPDEDDSERSSLLEPFAIVVGRAIAFDAGFAFGALGDAEGGTVSFVVKVGADGTSGSSLRLLRSRADLDPPVVAAVPGGSGLFAAVLEPNASGRAIRLAQVKGEEIAWGAEIAEGKDESLAIDLAVTERRGVVAWDAVDEDRSYVHVAGFSLDAIGTITSSRRATTKEMDADSPRLVATKNGFYLAYLVHGGDTSRDTVVDRGGDAPPSASAAPTASAKAKPPPAKKKPKKPKPDVEGAEPGDIDETRGGEYVPTSWIEVVPLDETGAQSSDAIRATPEGATVVSFDVALAPDGSLLVAYRDDDAPTGGAGGVVRMVSVRAGGLGASYASEDPLPSDGVPSVLAGWLGVPSLAGADLLAKLGPDGMPAEPLEREPSLGRGEPIAAIGARLLLAEPAGPAMKFRVVECGPAVIAPASVP